MNIMNYVKSPYLELAEKQFYALKEETISEHPKSLGAESTEEYEVNGIKINIHVDGYWEKSTWFNYTASNATTGEEVEKNTIY